MRKFILFTIIISMFLLNSVYAMSFSLNPGSDKSVVFVSRYDSSSMDPDTFEYFKRLKQDYSVYLC